MIFARKMVILHRKNYIYAAKRQQNLASTAVPNPPRKVGSLSQVHIYRHQPQGFRKHFKYLRTI